MHPHLQPMRIRTASIGQSDVGHFCVLSYQSSPWKGENPMEQTRSPEKANILAMIRSAQAGNEAAFTELFSMYEHLIDAQCAQYVSSAPSDQEARSEALAALWRAISTYDTVASPVAFGLYARICIGNALISAVRKWKRMEKPISLDSVEHIALRAEAESNPAHYVQEQEQYDALQARVRETLSPREQQIWIRFVAGYSSAEISRELGVEKKAVDNAIFRARRKLRRVLLPN